MEGWIVQGKIATFRPDEYEIEIEIEYDRLGFEFLRVRCDDQKNHYTHGSTTVATIPFSIIDELRSNK